MKNIFFAYVITFLTIPAFADVNLQKSNFHWIGTKKIGDGHQGEIKLKSATVDTKKGTGEFVMDLNSIDVRGLKDTFKAKFLNHLKSEDFFSVDKYPTAKLVISESGQGKAKGILTIRDKSNPVEIDYLQKGSTYTGTFKFDRTKYNVLCGSKHFFKQLVEDKIIDDEVTLGFTVIVD